MSGRSHRHRVPTASPPAQALGVLYLWGRGPIGSELRAYIRDSGAAVSEHDDVARKLALDHGCLLDVLGTAWAWRLEGVDARSIDEITQRDPSVMGWTQFQRETCPPSIALRNALNAGRAEENADLEPVFAARFGKPGHAHADHDPNVWIARDDRAVYRDAKTGKWRVR